jgi:hypothetical protein
LKVQSKAVKLFAFEMFVTNSMLVLRVMVLLAGEDTLIPGVAKTRTTRLKTTRTETMSRPRAEPTVLYSEPNLPFTTQPL